MLALPFSSQKKLTTQSLPETSRIIDPRTGFVNLGSKNDYLAIHHPFCHPNGENACTGRGRRCVNIAS